MQGFFNIIDILGKEKTGILIVIDHACMNKLKEEKPKNCDGAELVEVGTPVALTGSLCSHPTNSALKNNYIG